MYKHVRKNNYSGIHNTVVWKCTIKRDHTQKFPCNQLFSNFFSKNVDLTGKKCIFSQKQFLCFDDFSLILSHWKCKIFRQVNYLVNALVNPLFSRNFCP